MRTDNDNHRLGWRGFRLGFFSGTAGGAVSGSLALLLWGLTIVAFRIAVGEPLGASDPVTPQEAVLNAVFNAVFLGPLLGGMVGAFAGAMMGPFVPKARVQSLKLGVWVGTTLAALLGVVAVSGVAIGLPGLIEGGVSGAIGGRVADKLFGWLYNRYQHRSV